MKSFDLRAILNWGKQFKRGRGRKRTRQALARCAARRLGGVEQLEERKLLSGTTYYVNDSSQVQDVYCTAPGSDSNNGLTPATPKATLGGIFSAYTLKAGDTVYVDTGSYSPAATTTAFTIYGSSNSSDPYITIIGSPWGSVINDVNLGPSATVFEIGGNVAIEQMTIEFSSSGTQGTQKGINVDASKGGIPTVAEDEIVGALYGVNVRANFSNPPAQYVEIRNNIFLDDGYGACVIGTNWSSTCTCGFYFDNNTTSGCDYGVELYGLGGASSTISIENNIFDMTAGIYAIDGLPYTSSTAKTYCEYNCFWLISKDQTGDIGSAAPNLYADPLFANAATDDFHLMSKAGRYDPTTGLNPSKPNAWVTDTEDSPCIDAGDPSFSYSNEPAPNGGRINIGAYGNTPQASESDHPTVVSILPAGANPTNSGSVDFTVTFSEDVTGVDATNFQLAGTGISGVAITGVSPGSTSSALVYTVTVDTGSGDGSLDLNLTSGGSTDLLTNGTIYDDSGVKLVTGFVSTTGYVIDKTPPKVSVGAALLTDNNKPTLTGTVSDGASGSGIASVQVVVGGQTLTATVSNGTWTAVPSTPLADGAYNVQVTAVDNAGNSTSVTGVKAVVVDTAPPSTTGLAVTSSETNPFPSITATVSDVGHGGHNVAAAEYFIDTVGASGTGTPLSGAFTSPTVAVSGTVTAAQYYALSLGTHTIYVHGEDAAGNWETATASATFVKDIAAPTVTLVSPACGPAAGGTTVTITGTGFLHATAVNFGTVAATSFKIVSDTQITATSPAATANPADVTVLSAGGPSAVSTADQFLSLSPQSCRLGVYSGGYWYLDLNGNEKVDDTPVAFGGAGAIPVVGDWDGSGKTEIGAYNNGTWTLVTSSGVETFSFGFTGSNVIPVVGDWNGNGKTEVGVYCNGAWFRDVDGSHTWDATNQAALAYLGWTPTGTQSVVPVPGDWAGDGKTEMGVYCNGVWFLDSTGTGKYDGKYSYWGWSSPSSPLIPVVGNWSGIGDKDQFGVYNQGVWFRDADGTHQWDATNQAALAYYGWQGALPVVGSWAGATAPRGRQAPAAPSCRVPRRSPKCRSGPDPLPRRSTPPSRRWWALPPCRRADQIRSRRPRPRRWRLPPGAIGPLARPARRARNWLRRSKRRNCGPWRLTRCIYLPWATHKSVRKK